MTNWNKLTLVSAIALVAFTAPAAMAQRSERGLASRSMDGDSISQMRSISGGRQTTTQAHRSDGFRGGRSGHWRSGHHHRPRGFYPRRSYGYYRGFGYPYGFGSPYGYGSGYGYGYPYFGASAALYYHGYRPTTYRTSRVSVSVEIQQRLARAGYYRGAIDGVIGAGTSAAISAYQRDNRLPITGRIDERLLRRMGIRS
jgi:hypothetical protein